MLIGATVALASNQLPAAELYRWNDAEGNPVVSDRPPSPGTPYTTLNGKKYGAGVNAPGKPSSGAQSPSRTGNQPENKVASSAPGPQSGDGNVVIEKRPELCTQAKDNIFKLETFPRMRVKDDDGEVRFMTDEEREKQLATAKKVAEANC